MRRAALFALLVGAALACVGAKAPAQVATLSFCADQRGAVPQSVRATGKEIVVDLSALPQGAEVIRALLRPGRNERQAFGQRVKPVTILAADTGEPLALLPPRYKAFDATEAVRRALRAGERVVRFSVASFPGYQPKGTRLDVTCTARPRHAIAKVRGIEVWHRAGQTFITWREHDPPITEGTVTFARWKELLAQLAQAKHEIRYRIYRSAEPITAKTIARAELVDEVGPLTCWNPEFYGVYPKKEQTVPRYVVRDGQAPVAPGTGIYVRTCRKPGKAYYAVSVAIDGEEDLSQFDGGNSTSEPVLEVAGQGVPVLQRVVNPEKHFHYVTGATLYYFVRWEAPPNCNLPSRPFDYLVAVPAELPRPAPAGLHLHCWGGSLDGGYGWWYNARQGALLVATNQIPYDWWTGYHECWHTWRSWADGVVRGYTQRRLFSFLDWAATRWEIDQSRVFVAGSSMGGSGAPNVGIRWAHRVAWVVSWVGVHTPARSPGFRGSYERVYGKLEWGLKFENTNIPAFTYYDDTWYLREHPQAETPLICFSNGKNDKGIGWPQARDFWRALQETRRPHVFLWGQAGHGQRARLPGPKPTERDLLLDVRCDRTLPAFSNCSLDDNPGDGDPADGDPKGQSNLYLYWLTDEREIVDEPQRWALTLCLCQSAPAEQCTVDVTPRRCQRFKPRPGERFAWRNTSLATGKVVQTGEVQADRWGLVTLPQVIVSKGKNRVEIAAADAHER